MKRRQAIKTLTSAAAAVPLMRVQLRTDELPADQVFVLRDVAATVLPSAIGRKGHDEAVDNFLRWIRGSKEGAALSHGYGEPRLVRSGPSPRPGTSISWLRCNGRRRRAAGDSARCRSMSAASFSMPRSRPLTFAICPAVPTASTSLPT